MIATSDPPVVVVGSGLAGLVTALGLAPLPVLLVTEGRLGGGGSSALAQGGIAAAVGRDDEPALHAQDTMAAGDGLTDPATARLVTAEAPAAIAFLRRIGVRFDLDADGGPALTLEAAHSRRRVLHAGGDRSGAALVDTLAARVRAVPEIELAEETSLGELLLEDGSVTGVVLQRRGALIPLAARAVVLATGGVGALYASTTNPLGNRGSGLVLAARAGAVLRDLEFVQFHPTAIDVGAGRAGAPLPLASEAIRGEGARLVDELGEPAMAGVPGGDLAPRDQVARAIWQRLQAGRRVFLDARAALGPRFATRFPGITALCHAAGIDPVAEAIPVRPAAHYHMGGIATDLHGRTSVAGLWAVGEVASTGLHGANRLASNSLLEAVVLGRRAAADIAGEPYRSRPCRLADHTAPRGPMSDAIGLRRGMEAGVGVVRDRTGLEATIARLAERRRRLGPESPLGRMAEAALLIAVAALNRHESRGAHTRRDHPGPAAGVARHQSITRAEAEASIARITAQHAEEEPA